VRRLARGLGWIAAALAVVVGGRGLWILRGGGEDATRARAVASLRWLSDDLDGKANRMQTLFPEGRVFTAALTGIAWAQVGVRDTALAAEALRQSRAALVVATDAASKRTFGAAGGLPHGMFYEAWTTRLHVAVAGLARAQGEAYNRAAFHTHCRRLQAAMSDGPVFPDSYPGQAWPADAVVGAAALGGCGVLLDASFRNAAHDWLRRAQTEVDPATGLLPHAASTSDIRGSSSALMISFLAEIDRPFAEDQYARFASAFPTRLGGFIPAIREYPRGASGPGDVDSGPLVLGASAPASVVGIAAARLMGDVETAAGLRASSEALGVPISWFGRRRYAFGAIPVGDAFLAWATTVARLDADRASPFAGWRTRWAIVSALLLAVGLGGGVRLWRTRYSASSSRATTGR